jgi:hypothetical protein
VIAPRRTRLVRVADLHAFRRAIVMLSVDGSLTSTRSRLVVVPTRGAARQLRRTIEDARLAAAKAVVLPDVVTREQLYDRLCARVDPALRRLSAFEREAIIHAAADAAAAVTRVRRLSERIGIPPSLAAVKVPPEGIPALAADAMKSGNIPLNPRPTSYDDMVRLFQQCM